MASPPNRMYHSWAAGITPAHVRTPQPPSTPPRRPVSTPYHATPFRRKVEQLNPEHESRSLGLKIFVIFVVVIGAVILVTGVLALLSAKGVLPNGVNTIGALAEIGEVNSALMIGGGFALFAAGIAAWTCHLRKELQASLERERPIAASSQDAHSRARRVLRFPDTF